MTVSDSPNGARPCRRVAPGDRPKRSSGPPWAFERNRASEAGNARRQAARSRREADLAGQHFVVVLLHVLLYPRLQIRIAEIGDPIGGLPSGAIGNERMCRIVDEGGQLAGNRA